MYVEPGTAGLCRIKFVYDGGVEMRWARILSLLTVLALVALSIRGLVKH